MTLTDKIKLSKALKDALEDAGYETRSYSGRGMYGRACLGVNTDDRDEFSIGLALGQSIGPDFLGHIPTPSYDSMGLGSIVYWPSLPWPEEERT